MDEYIEIAQSIAPKGWEVESESTLICPHGHCIEWDGECPEGCESFLRAAGMI